MPNQNSKGAVKKQALAIITGPYQLLQIIWYASEHPEYAYDVLIKTAHMNEAVKQGIRQNCVNAGLFRSVLIARGVNKDSGALRQGLLFLKMLGCWVTGQRSRLTRRMIRDEIGDRAYDLVLVDSENSLLGGAFIDHSDREYKVVILQEGMSDVLPRLDRPKPGPKDWLNFALARMGYCNPGLFYKLDKVRHCTKLSSFADRLLYKPFAAIEDIFVGQGSARYQQAIQKAWPAMDWDLFNVSDTIVITSLMEILGGGEAEYAAMMAWLKQNSRGTLLFKRHPRDVYPYEWKDLDVRFIDTGVPAELILSRVTNQTLVFSFISTCILDIMDRGVDYKVIRFDSIKGEYYNRIFSQLQDQLGLPEERIVHLG